MEKICDLVLEMCPGGMFGVSRGVFPIKCVEIESETFVGELIISGGDGALGWDCIDTGLKVGDDRGRTDDMRWEVGSAGTESELIIDLGSFC